MEEQNKPVMLVIDDDHDDQLLVDEALKKLDLQIEPRYLENGREALRYLQRNGRFSDEKHSPRPALILLDLNMPFMDGRATLKALKADRKLRDIPVVVMTTSHSDEDRQACDVLGANGYYKKPNTFIELKEILYKIYKSWIAPKL